MAPPLIRHALLALLLALCAGCGHLFYFPEKGLRGTPDQVGIPYEDVYLTSADGMRLHGWFLPARPEAGQPRRGLIYFLHGNAENISTHFVAVSWLNRYGWDLFLLDYRGFGLSEGAPHIRGAHLDARAGLDWAVARARRERLPLVVYGQSLGGATAATLVAHSQPGEVQALVLDSAFSGYRRIAREKLEGLWLTSLLRYPLAWTIRDDYSPDRYLAHRPPMPLLIMHGCADITVPCSHGERLYEVAAPPAWLWLDPQRQHGEMVFVRSWREQLVRWLDEQVPSP